MSSLRLALKQSLQETGHLAPTKEKRRKNPSSSTKKPRRRPRQPGEPPRKRGRPRKNPVVEQPASASASNKRHSDDDDDDDEEDHSESENEFSYDSEEEEESQEEDEDDEEDEDEEEEEEEGDDHEEDESGHPEEEDEETAEHPPSAVKSQSHQEEHHADDEDDGEASVNGDGYVMRRKKRLKKKKRHHDAETTTSDEDRRRQRKLLKKQLKHSAANLIQAQWKKKKGKVNKPTRSKEPQQPERQEEAAAPSTTTSTTVKRATSPTKEIDSTTPTNTVEKKRKEKRNYSSSSKSHTVPHPEPEVLEWSRTLSEKRCRRHIASGMRVKVRFAAKVKRDGKVIKRKVWYGGRVSAVSKEGSKIRIKYDDSTSEISKFPDKDVVVDDTFNGHHLVPADKFIPPTMTEEELEPDEDEDEEEEFVDNVEEPRAEPKHESSVAPTQSAKPSTDEQDKSKDDISAGERLLTKIDEPTETPVRPAPDASNIESSEEPVKEVEMTPILKVSENQPKNSSKASLPSELASPEDGELSTGSMFPTDSSATTAPKPMDVEEAPPKEKPKEKPSSPPRETSHAPRPEPTQAPELKEDKPVEYSETTPALAQKVDEPYGEPIPVQRSSLKIRITNIKQEEKDAPPKNTPNSSKQIESDSEEELFADTPVTERKVRSIEMTKKTGDKPKRKRDTSDASEDPPPSKRRIHLKRDREVEAIETNNEDSTILVTPDITEPTADTSNDVEDVVEAPSSLAKSDRGEEPSKKENTTISISLRRSETEEEPLVGPKMKKKKERVNSPNPKGRKSPVNKRSTSPTGIESPASPASDAKPVAKPFGKSASSGDVAAVAVEESATPKRPLGSKNSAFSRKQPKEAPDDTEIQPPETEVQEEADEMKVSLPRTKASTESLPNVRTGRRAAQQAKEKINTKQDPSAVPESGKKKKKRRRKEGDDDGEHSDESVDDRQWVQCDSCAKWRILPSSVKITSLPKHWYCHLNIYDPKRNNCTAPEQTAKQAAKEWRRARKRAKLQRLEQQATELEGAQEEPKKDTRKDLTLTNSPKPTKGVKKLNSIASGDSKRSSPTASEDNPPPSAPAEAGSELPKVEKKGKKGKPQEATEPQIAPPESAPEAPKKPGRKRGRPARNQTPQKEKDDSDNVEWVQCEKCEKWRKLPPQISADELPDKWYCTMNNWNPDSASCEMPEDKADATHTEVGNYPGLFAGAAGKYSYRSMIFGTGRKHNRPMSERSRASESLFMRPVDEIENPHPTVMYSKSSAFLPRTSNFTKASTIEEDKTPSIFDVLSNSDLWAELRGVSQPMDVVSSDGGQAYPKFLSFENLPDDVKQTMREVILHALGCGALTGDDVIRETERYPWESLSSDLAAIRDYFNADIIINTLLALVRDGVVEMTCLRDLNVPMAQWVPRYRKVRSSRALEIEESMKASRCMKIAKPWKQREENKSDWVSGGSAFA